MSRAKQLSIATLFISVLFIIGCGHPHSGAGNTPSAATHADDKVVDLFIWADYLAPQTGRSSNSEAIRSDPYRGAVAALVTQLCIES